MYAIYKDAETDNCELVGDIIFSKQVEAIIAAKRLIDVFETDVLYIMRCDRSGNPELGCIWTERR